MKLKTRLLIGIIGIAFIFISAGIYRWNIEIDKQLIQTTTQYKQIISIDNSDT